MKTRPPKVSRHACERYAERFPINADTFSVKGEPARYRVWRLWPLGCPATPGGANARRDGATYWKLPDGAVCVVKHGEVVTVLVKS